MMSLKAARRQGMTFVTHIHHTETGDVLGLLAFARRDEAQRYVTEANEEDTQHTYILGEQPFLRPGDDAEFVYVSVMP